MKKALALSTLLSLATIALSGCGGSGVKTIGVLQFGAFEALEKAKNGFVETINASTWKDKVNIEVRSANAVAADNVAMAKTLAATSDLVYGIATPSASALKNAMDSLGYSTPILFSAVTNPSGANLLTNLEKPEGRCTGVVDLGPIEKELELLAKFEGVDKITSMYTSTEVNSVYQAEIAEKWMDAHNIAHTRTTITSASEITSALSSIPSDVDAVFLPTDDTIANSIGMIKSANEERTDKLIIAACDTGMVSGSTIAMGVDYYECGVQAGKMAIKVLEGTAISSIPVESCDKDALVINKTLATSLGITIPESLLNEEGAKII
ncbi:MAG: ABC transporter substrate-binding protein [Bacilli bacterium]|nr:ABC transporter substrate-binding protein [Bacilli bacterium]